MGYIATMDHVRTIIILFELNTYCYTRPNVYMYMCSLGSHCWSHGKLSLTVGFSYLSLRFPVDTCLLHLPFLFFSSHQKLWSEKILVHHQPKIVEGVVLTNSLGESSTTNKKNTALKKQVWMLFWIRDPSDTWSHPFELLSLFLRWRHMLIGKSESLRPSSHGHEFLF